MFWRTLRMGLVAGVLLTGAVVTARADHGHHHGTAASDCGSSGTVVSGDGCGPTYRTVYVQEWVPEQYQTTRTTYRTEQRQEAYTAYRTETVPETRTRTYTVNRMVTETQMQTRTYTVKVPVVETRTVMQNHVSYKQVTEMVNRTVDRGHWECREECVSGHGGGHLLGKLFHRHGKSGDCCDPCGDACAPVRTKTVRVWVANCVTEQVPVTRCVKVCEQRPVTVNVTTCKTETRTEQVPVTVCRCVPETKTENYTVNVCRQVAYQANRTVCVSVPVTENVTATRMVCRTVAKQVPNDTCCETTCCKPRHRLFGGHGLFSRHHGSGCGGCSSCCD